MVAVTPDSERALHFRPFYGAARAARAGAPGNGAAAPELAGLHWLAKRRASGWRTDDGADVMLSFVDRSGRSAHPDQDTITARLTCYNGELPSRLAFGNPTGDFEMEGAGPVRQITALVKPTRVIQPALGNGQTWRLV